MNCSLWCHWHSFHACQTGCASLLCEQRPCILLVCRYAKFCKPLSQCRQIGNLWIISNFPSEIRRIHSPTIVPFLFWPPQVSEYATSVFSVISSPSKYFSMHDAISYDPQSATVSGHIIIFALPLPQLWTWNVSSCLKSWKSAKSLFRFTEVN